VKPRRGPNRDGLNEEVRRIWDANADWWDDRIGEGNALQRELVEPATERLIGDIAGAEILDVACGAGRFARRMAELGGSVVAFDFSERFIARARERTAADVGNIDYHVIDATDEEQLLSLGTNRFDVAVATMALMDMSTLDPLVGALRTMLKPEGRFVFSVLHPCFPPGEAGRFMEETTADGRCATRTGVKVTRYLSPATTRGEGIVGQPEPQYYFHRPLSLLLRPAFEHGFVVDRIEEPAFQERAPQDVASQWHRMSEIPPVLLVRMRIVRA